MTQNYLPKGYNKKYLAQCFQPHGDKPGVSFKLKAAFADEAIEKAKEIIHEHHGDFERRTGGNYKIKLADITKQQLNL